MAGEMLASPAYAALKPSGKRVLGTIENELSKHGDGVPISLSEMMARSGLCRAAARYGIWQCERLQFVVISVGERRVHWFAMSDGWKSIDQDEAQRLMALAHQRPARRARISTVPREATQGAKAAEGRATALLAAQDAITADDAVAG